MSEKLPAKLIADLNKRLSKINVRATEDFLNTLLDGTYAKQSMIEINGIDTAECEMFQEILAQKLTGMEWPCNADSKEKEDKFIKALIDGVNAEDGLSWIDEEKTV